ncbi:MAG: hypothetical protein QNJ08_06620 [Crocosphaera sp.]|nr:hypothetical protein [Crocosphaera sp.]
MKTITTPKRRVVGVGNVGKEPGNATYTLYSPHSDRLEFKTVSVDQKLTCLGCKGAGSGEKGR